jgi:hypothetical protein
MRALRLIAWIAAVALPLGCAWPRGARVREVRVRVTDIDFDRVKVAVELDVRNSGGQDLPAPDYALAFDVEGQVVAKASGEASHRLPAGQTTPLHLPAEISYRHLYRAVRYLASAPAAPYRLTGTLQFPRAGTAHFRSRGTLPILRAPQFTDIQLTAPEQVSPQMGLTFLTRLTNPNAFEIGLRGLRYDLHLGDDQVGGLVPESSPVLGPGQSEWIRFRVQLTALPALVKTGFNYKDLLKQKRRIVVQGTLQTPYGTVPLHRDR